MQGAIALAPAIAVCKSLSHLDLSANELCGIDVLGQGAFTSEGIMAIAAAIRVNSFLTCLSTAHNEISGDGAQQLADAVLAMPTLESFSGIPLKELRADCLTSLDLSDKGLGVTEALVLANLVGFVSKSLTSLNLKGNELGAQGAAALAPAIAASGLIAANLLANRLDIESAALLLEIKAHRPSLRTLCGLTHNETQLDLERHNLGPGDAMLLAQEIGLMGSLSQVCLALVNGFCHFVPPHTPGCAVLARALIRKRARFLRLLSSSLLFSRPLFSFLFLSLSR